MKKGNRTSILNTLAGDEIRFPVSNSSGSACFPILCSHSCYWEVEGLAMVVNRVSGESVWIGDSVDPVYKPSIKQADSLEYVDCRPVDRSSIVKKTADSYLNMDGITLTVKAVRAILLSSKSYKHKLQHSKTKKLSRVQVSMQWASSVRAGGRQFTALEPVGRDLHFLYALLSVRRKVPHIMSTTQNPSFVCDTLQTPSSRADQVSTNWEDLQPIQSQQPEQPPELAEWPVFMVDVPSDWIPKSGSELPPNAKRFKSGSMAVAVAAMLNREILKQSTDGTVQSWYIRISKRSERQGVVSVSIPDYLDWRPSSEHDMPPAQVRIKGKLSSVRGEVASMNQALSEDQYKEHRFYIGFALDRIPDKDDPKQPKTVEAAPVKDQEPEKEFGLIYLVDVPSKFNASSWKALPSMFQKVKNKEIAKIVAIDGNQRILSRSQDGIVNSWYAVVEAVGGFGIVQVTIPANWKPADAYDMPKTFNVIEGRKERTEYIKTLNQQFDRITNKNWRKRAYSALRITRPEPGEDQPEAKPEPQAAPAERQPIPVKSGHSVSGVLQVGKPVKRYRFTGELVSVSDPVKDDPKPETADALLKRHGLEIHQVNVDQRDKRLERFLSEMK